MKQVLAVFVLLVCLSCALAAETEPQARAPFLNLRARALGYAGPQKDGENLAEVRLGWFGPSGDTNSAAGNDLWWAASFAVREANEQGGCEGRPFRLLPRWSADPWGSGVSQLARMVYEDRPVALLGGIDSTSTHLAEQVVTKAQLPLVSPVATDKTATLAGVPWMFSCAPSDAAIARVLTSEISRVLKSGSPRLALLSGTDHESRMTAREVLRELSTRGRLPDFRFEFPPGVTAPERQLAALAESRPGIVTIIASAEDSARLVSAVRDILPAAMLFGGHQMGRTQFRGLAGAKAEGVCFPNLALPSANDERAAQFKNAFEAAHRHAPDYAAMLTYDSARLLLQAVRRAGPDCARIREVLLELSPWHGILGPITFDGTGQNTREDIALCTIRAGAVVAWEPARQDGRARTPLRATAQLATDVHGVQRSARPTRLGE